MSDVIPIKPAKKRGRKKLSGPSAEVLIWDGITGHDLPADRVLEQATDKLDEVMVIGFTKEGCYYFASSVSDGGKALWHLEMAKKHLLECAETIP